MESVAGSSGQVADVLCEIAILLPWFLLPHHFLFKLLFYIFFLSSFHHFLPGIFFIILLDVYTHARTHTYTHLLYKSKFSSLLVRILLPPSFTLLPFSFAHISLKDFYTARKNTKSLFAFSSWSANARYACVKINV